MHYNPFKKGPFVMYLVALTIGPTFFTTSIYICLARIIVVFGEPLSRFKLRTYTIAFITSDVISLIPQVISGAIASGAGTRHKKQTSIDIVVAGLAFQFVSLVLCMLLCADFARAVAKVPRS
ncbi:RTA-like protein [Clohesyomyces aquaticus]|uniref:RTA-like protein n=1 Tax=Clohesyomyces aquaticus TaxID=1231657 RepID=A0A1Y1ZSC8_9PLEO|nr:RTA-like protein [Clohesyomyces aquaticus]